MVPLLFLEMCFRGSGGKGNELSRCELRIGIPEWKKKDLMHE